MFTKILKNHNFIHDKNTSFFYNIDLKNIYKFFVLKYKINQKKIIRTITFEYF